MLYLAAQNENHNTTAEQLSLEPSCSQHKVLPMVAIPEKSCDNPNESNENSQLYSKSSFDVNTLAQNSSEYSNSQEAPHKIRISHIYSESNESMTQCLDPTDIVPKSENDETEEARESRNRIQNRGNQIHLQQQQQHHTAEQTQFFTSYNQQSVMPANVSQEMTTGNQTQYSSSMVTRFRSE